MWLALSYEFVGHLLLGVRDGCHTVFFNIPANLLCRVATKTNGQKMLFYIFGFKYKWMGVGACYQVNFGSIF